MKEYWRTTIVVTIGVAFGAIPEWSMVMLVVFGGLLLFTTPIHWSSSTVLILLLFTGLRMVLNSKNQGWWFGLIEGCVISMLARATLWFRLPDVKHFLQAALLGLTITLTVAGAYAFGFVQHETVPNTWSAKLSRATWQNLEGFDRVVPKSNDLENVWVERELGLLWPGKVQYEFMLRSDPPRKIEIFFSHGGVKNGQIHATCQVMLEWTPCKLSATLTKRALGFVGLGGYNSWRVSEGAIEVKTLGLKVLEQPTWLDRLRLTSRQAGLTFNPNALGAITVLVGVFALSILPVMPFGMLAITQMFLGVFISGSRNALITLLACFAALYGLNAKNLKTTVLIIACVITFIGFSMWLLDGNVRFLEFQKEENQISRVHLFIEAVKQSMNNPVRGFGPEGIKILNSTLSGQLAIPSPVAHTHNLFAQSYLEQGLIGLTMIFSLIFIGIFSALQQQNKIALVLLMAILSFNTGDYFFYYAPFQITFWLVLHGMQIPKSTVSVMLSSQSVLRKI